MFKTLLVLHLATTWCLVGLIWTVQVVHYPLFAWVGQAQFVAYEAEHARRISFLVGPLMLLELLTAMALLAYWPPSLPSWLGWGALALLAGIWLSTLLVSVPLHARLATGFDPLAHAHLVTTNWIRTLLWSARGLLLVWILLKATS